MSSWQGGTEEDCVSKDAHALQGTFLVLGLKTLGLLWMASLNLNGK